MKKLVIESNLSKFECEIDPELFDNDQELMYHEAINLALERWATIPNSKVGVILKCYEKRAIKNTSAIYFNTYFSLIRVRMYKQAKTLRQALKTLHGIDLKDETERSFT